jgi:hypothetical protein
MGKKTDLVYIGISLIETLRNLPGFEEVKTEIVLDRIKEDHSIIIPE